MKRLLALPLAFAVATAAYAHNGMDHVLGTLTSITPGSLLVHTTKGADTAVLLDAKTVWMRGKATVTAKDAHTGDRVVIHAAHKDGKLVAAEVDLGTATH